MPTLADAGAHLQSGDLGQAEAICRAVLNANPDPAAYRVLAEISRLRHDLPTALENARRALELGPNQPESLFCCGAALLHAGHIDAAIDHLDLAIEQRPLFAEAQIGLSYALEVRARYEARYLVSVITATTGRSTLKRAIDSVQAQTYPHIEHVIVIDGPGGAGGFQQMLPRDTSHDIHVISLPFNTGAGGYLGHRIYGACLYLVNGRYVAFLDEDNWFEPHHVASLMQLIESKGLEWSYSLRNIMDRDGHLITQDDCQSLGPWPTWYDASTNLVDMNCYLVRRDLAIRASPTFLGRSRDEGGVDFRLCRLLLDTAKRFDTNGDYTVNYTAGNRKVSMTGDFFLAGNKVMRERYRRRFPWRKSTGSRPRRARRRSAKSV
jgi:hypothetical protein